MEETVEKRPISAFTLFSKSSELVRNNLGTFALIYLLPFISNLGQLDSDAHENGFERLQNFNGFSGVSPYAIGGMVGFGVLLFLAFAAIWLLVNAMKYTLELESSKGKKPDVKQLWPFAKKYWWRLFGLLFVTVLLIFGGLLLLIVPGLIAIRRYFLAPYVMIDKDLSISEALRQSAALSKPYSSSIWSIVGVMVLISLPSFIPVVGWIITFVLAMLYSIAPALRYQELKNLNA